MGGWLSSVVPRKEIMIKRNRGVLHETSMKVRVSPIIISHAFPTFSSRILELKGTLNIPRIFVTAK